MHKKCPVVAYVFVNLKKKGKRRNNCFFSSIRHEIFCLTKSWQLVSFRLYTWCHFEMWTCVTHIIWLWAQSSYQYQMQYL